ncbi:ABC-type branched-subunit amino acid transport system substrate-binding protein [Bradyrhizobium sp. LB7.2]
MKKRLSVALRISLGAAAAGALMTASGAALAADPIKIGVIAEAQAIAGASIPQAAQLAADEINATGGVDGRKIEIIGYDNHSSSADSVRAFQRAVNEDKVQVVIASYISEVVLALEPWASRLKTPFVTPGAASNEISKSVHADYEKNKYTFHGYLTSAALALSVCDGAKDLLVDKMHMKTAVIMSEDAAWTKPLDVGYEECLPKIGLKVLDHIRFSPDTTDFTPIFNKIEGLKARRDHHRYLPCRRAADGAVEEPAGADPDVRHLVAGHQRDFWQGYQPGR